jgi:hypothetical protein
MRANREFCVECGVELELAKDVAAPRRRVRCQTGKKRFSHRLHSTLPVLYIPHRDGFFVFFSSVVPSSDRYRY